MTRKPFAALALAAAAVLALAGCSSSAAPSATATGDGKVQVVASTNVYGDLASTVGGDLVESWGGVVRLADFKDGFSTTQTIAKMTGEAQ